MNFAMYGFTQKIYTHPYIYKEPQCIKPNVCLNIHKVFSV